MTKLRDGALPDLVDTSPNGIRNWAKQIKLALQTLTGDVPLTNEGALDQAVTFRDLIESGIAVEAPVGSRTAVLAGDGSTSNFAAPPAPTGFIVERLPYNMRLRWDAPTYQNLQETQVWRADADNLSNASQIATVPGDLSQYEDGYLQAAFYWVRFVSKAGVIGGFNAIPGTSDNSQPGDVGGLTFAFEGFGVRLRWSPVIDTDLASYEVRLGATWETGTPMDGGAPGRGTDTGGSNTYLWKIQIAGTYRVFVRARDVTGFYSGSATSIDVTISAPSAVSFPPTSPIVGDSLSLSWGQVAGTFAIDYYEVRLGDTWASAITLDRAFATIYFQKVNWGGSRRFWVAARDVAGNYGTPVSVDVIVTVPSIVGNLRAEVVDNNVLLFWNPPTGTLPIQTYEIYRGATFLGAVLVGDKNGLFTSIFEQISGNYTYWVRARDTAGNVGTPAPVTSFVNQPPDYVLYSDLNADISLATRSNADFDGTGIVLPFNTSETWDTHYTSRAWTNDNDAIAAGFPVYAQPAPASGYYELQVDYGAVIPTTGIQVSPTMIVVAGSPTYTVQISHKLNIGDPWTDMPLGPSGFISTTFRYVKVRVTATTSGGGVGLYRSTGLNIRLNVKQKTLSGQGTANSGDSGGTTFYLTKDGTPGGEAYFVDMFGPPIVQPVGTTPIIPVVDFTDAPAPTSFKVLLFNNSGTRVTAAISWTARGV